MNIRKLLVISLLSLMVLGCVSSVSAGWFDFLDSNMEEHDFGNFTANVPKGSVFEKFIQPNGEDSVSKLADELGGYVSVNFSDPKWNDAKYAGYFHDCWSTGDDDTYLQLEYIDVNEDKLDGIGAVEELYAGAVLNKSDGDTSTYYWSSFNNYIIKKDNSDKTAYVVVRGKDYEIVSKIADSIKFKS